MDKRAIAAGFSRAAETYDAYAEVQRRMAERLASILPTALESRAAFDAIPPGAEPIVELGCGTGLLTELLLARYPDSGLRGIDLAPGMVEHCRRRFVDHVPRPTFEIADADRWRPVPPVALIVSNCTFQWLEDAPRALVAMRESLAPGGRAGIGALLAGSLAELDASHRAATGGAPMPALDLWDEGRWRKELARAGLRLLEPPSGVESLAIEHAGPLDVLRALRGIGAWLGGRDAIKRDSGANAARPLSPVAMRHLARHYREHYSSVSGARVVATYRAMFIIAEAAS